MSSGLLRTDFGGANVVESLRNKLLPLYLPEETSMSYLDVRRRVRNSLKHV